MSLKAITRQRREGGGTEAARCHSQVDQADASDLRAGALRI